MHPGRVDVIGGGALVLDRIMQRFGFGEVLVSEHDILDGIAWSLAGGCARGLDQSRRPPDGRPGRAIRPGRIRRSRTAPRRSPSWPGGAATLGELTARQSVCRACPRLVAWREEVAATRRRAFRDERYWGRPIPGWGSERPRLLIVGLAPAAHGGNRTGRIFTGDRSGDFLFASLYRCGFAVQPTSVAAGDGQRLVGARMAAAVRCAPPANKPEPAERDACAPWLVAELRLVAADLRVIVCLGGFAWQAIWPVLGRCGFVLPRPRPGVRPRCRGTAGEPAEAGRRAADRLLSPEPAEHVHRSRHPGHAGRRIHPGPRGGRPGKSRRGYLTLMSIMK